MYFPLELPLGKHIPLYGSIPGRSFRLRHHPETTSQSERGFRDGLSAWAAIGKACPGLRCQGVFFTAAPCIEFDSPRFGESVDGLRPGQDARSASHLYLAGALRGESAYLLRKSAPARPPAGVLARSLQTLRVCLTLAPCIEFDSTRYGLEIKRQVDINIYLPVTYGGAYEKNGELHQYRHPRGYPTRYLHCKGIEKLVCCRWNVPEIAISGVCKIPDGRLAVSPSNARKRGTPCQGAPLER